jgi:hypothetical protein
LASNEYAKYKNNIGAGKVSLIRIIKSAERDSYLIKPILGLLDKKFSDISGQVDHGLNTALRTITSLKDALDKYISVTETENVHTRSAVDGIWDCLGKFTILTEKSALEILEIKHAFDKLMPVNNSYIIPDSKILNDKETITAPSNIAKGPNKTIGYGAIQKSLLASLISSMQFNGLAYLQTSRQKEICDQVQQDTGCKMRNIESAFQEFTNKNWMKNSSKKKLEMYICYLEKMSEQHESQSNKRSVETVERLISKLNIEISKKK